MYTITHEGEGARHVAILRDEEFGSEVRVAVGLGFNVFSFKVRTPRGFADILYADPGFPNAGMRATSSGTPILVPFPNRIAGGKFTYKGKSYQLPCNDHGVNAIHGFAFDRPWRIVEESTEVDARITGEFEMLRDSESTEENWPGNFRVRCVASLRGNWLTQTFFVKNLSSVRIPFGLGTHPYFRMPTSGNGFVDECMLRAPATKTVVLDQLIPNGQTIRSSEDYQRTLSRIGRRQLDHVFTALTLKEGEVRCSLFDEQAAVSVSQYQGREFLYVVVYIPPHRQAICIEPYTCVTNAVNLGMTLGPDGPPTGLWNLDPEEERRLCIQLQIVRFPRVKSESKGSPQR